MVSIEKRLQELLDQKEQEIADLEAEVDELKNTVKQAEAGWSLPVALKVERNLPVPRLEMLIESRDDFRYVVEWRYRMIYRHFLGHLVAVPLGYTESLGGDRNGKAPRDFDGKLQLPYRDGAHIKSDAKNLGMPAYIVCGDIEESIDP